MVKKIKKMLLQDVFKSLYNLIKKIMHRVLQNNQINDNDTTVNDIEINVIKSQEPLLDETIVTKKENINTELLPSKKKKRQEDCLSYYISPSQIKKEISEWVFKNYPSHYLSIQFPWNYRSESYSLSLKLLHKIMVRFEYNLLRSRYWNKKHVPFIAIAENGRSYNWHFHILINLKEYQCINKLINQTLKDINMPLGIINVRSFTGLGKRYALKEIEIAGRKVRTDRIIPSNVLFDIPVKQETSSIFS